MLFLLDPPLPVPGVTTTTVLAALVVLLLAALVLLVARGSRADRQRARPERDLDESVLSLVMANPDTSLRAMARSLGVHVEEVKQAVERLVEAGILGVREVGGELRFDAPGIEHPELAEPEEPLERERRTAVRLVDVALPDGVAPGTTVLVVGRSGAGMELLLKDVAAAAERATLLTANEDPRDVEAAIRGQRPDAPVEVRDLAAGFGSDAPTPTDGDDVPALAALVKEAADGADGVVVLDSLDILFEHHAQEAVVRSARALVTATRSGGGGLVLGLTRGIVPDETESQLASMADVVLELEVERWNPEPEWVLHLRKVRNAPEGLRSIPYRPDRDGHLVLAGRNRIRSARWTRG